MLFRVISSFHNKQQKRIPLSICYHNFLGKAVCTRQGENSIILCTYHTSNHPQNLIAYQIIMSRESFKQKTMFRIYFLTRKATCSFQNNDIHPQYHLYTCHIRDMWRHGTINSGFKSILDWTRTSVLELISEFVCCYYFQCQDFVHCAYGKMAKKKQHC